MAKSLNKEQLINVVVALVAAELNEKHVDEDDFRDFLETYTVEELVEATSDVDNVTNLVDEYEDYNSPEGNDLEDDQEDDDLTEESMQDILDNLHVGYNVVPGLGAGYASDEEDLKNLKVFVAGALAVKGAIQTFLG